MEVADTTHMVMVRDTTARGAAVLSIPADAWQGFTDVLTDVLK